MQIQSPSYHQALWSNGAGNTHIHRNGASSSGTGEDLIAITCTYSQFADVIAYVKEM